MKRGYLKRKTPLKLYGHSETSVRQVPLKRKTGLRRKSKSESATLAEKLWALCRKIIFQRHGTDCWTCPATGLTGRNLHLGHFITDATCSTELSYHLDNLRPQCYRCNIHLSGNWIAYEARMIKEGIDVDALKRLNEATKGGQYGTLWYLATIQDYERLVSKSVSPRTSSRADDTSRRIAS